MAQARRRPLALRSTTAPAQALAAPPERWWCVECAVTIAGNDPVHAWHPLRRLGAAQHEPGEPRSVPLPAAASRTERRYPTGLPIDRVLGGGVVTHGVYLLSGDPGAGKTTILTAMAAALAMRGVRVLYATGEETEGQVATRARRLGAAAHGVRLLATGSLETLLSEVAALHAADDDPDVIIIDSAQAVASSYVGGEAGSVAQVRHVGHRLTALAKREHRAILIAVQVNKDLEIAGPKTLEHTGDAHLHLSRDEGDVRHLRALKNRFASTHEAVSLEMWEGGLRETRNPAALALDELAGGVGVAACPVAGDGPVVVAAVEASVTAPAEEGESAAAHDAIGLRPQRLRLLLDLLRQHACLTFARRTVRVRVPRIAGAVVEDPGLDLAVCAAILSAWHAVPCPTAAAFGEVGLSGRVQRVARSEARMEALRARPEAQRTVIAPPRIAARGIAVREVSHVEALGELFADHLERQKTARAAPTTR